MLSLTIFRVSQITSQVHTASLRSRPCHWVTGEGRINFLVPNGPLSKLHCEPELETEWRFAIPTGNAKELPGPRAQQHREGVTQGGTRSRPEGSRSLRRDYNHFVLQHEAPRCSPRPARASPFTHYSCYVSLNSVVSLRRLPGK